ncbi:MAG: sulfatase-like hydrolase/transferase [Pirellulaceae bacterium]
MPDARPNILWYCADAQRYDTIHALGAEAIRTPTLDRLARQGVAFTRAYCQTPICTPSRASFLTGRYPATTHVYRNGHARFPAGEVLVTKRLADAGYDCGLAGKLHLSTAKFGERRYDDGYRVLNYSNLPYPDDNDQGNHYYDWLRGEHGVDPYELFHDRASFCGAGVPSELHQVTWCSEMAIRFLSEKRDGPWLMSVNPFDPHPPFDPPQEYLDRYDPSQLPPPLFRESDLQRQHDFANIRQQKIEAVDPFGEMPNAPPVGSRAPNTYKAPDRFNGQMIKAAYYAMIEHIDHQLGRIVDALEETGQRENTIILFHSDHGELLGDHGLIFKGCRFFEGAVHVPLMFSCPKRFQANLQSDALVELVDMAPTLLEAAGIQTPKAMQGRSLAPILTGQADPSIHREIVVCDFNDSVGYSPVQRPTQATMTFDGRYKMVMYHRENGLGELFDLEEDPGEFDNLWTRPELQSFKLARMQQHIDAVLATVSPGEDRVATY